MLTAHIFISIHMQSTAYGRNKRAEKHSSSFTAQIGTVSLSPPKPLSGRVTLASLSLVNILCYPNLFINKTYQTTTCTWKCVVLGFFLGFCFWFFLVFFNKNKQYFFNFTSDKKSPEPIHETGSTSLNQNPSSLSSL